MNSTSKLNEADSRGKLVVTDEAVSARADARLLRLVGEVDLSSIPVLKHHMNEAIQNGTVHLILNFEQVAYMDSSGFGTLFSALKRLRPIGGSLRLIGCQGPTLRMLEITRLDTVMGNHATLNGALDAINRQEIAVSA